MSTIQRITGTNSGLDVDSLVKSSMTRYQNQIDKETQNKKVLEYQQEQYKQIMSDASSFYDKYFDILKTGSLRSTSTYESVSFTSKDDSKVTAKGFAGADVNDYKVSITQLASKATASFKSADLLNGTKLSVKIPGKDEISVDIVQADGQANMQSTADKLTTALNAAGIAVSAKYSEFSKSIVLESGSMGESTSFQAGVDSNYQTYTGTNAKGVITKGTETYNIDKDSNTVTVDNVQFSLKGVTIGAATASKHITSSSITSLLGDDVTKIVKNSDNTVYTLTNNSKITIKDDGTVAITKTDGATALGSTDTVTVTSSDGTTKTIKGDGTLSTEATDTSVSLTGKTDVTALKDKIVKFVDDYNTLLKSISTKIFETRDKSYMPLTDEQKKSMTDSQITAWETKAKTGLLRKDSDLERITGEMKSAMSSVMSGSGAYLESIGIKPVDDYTDKNGTFTVDESKLTQALENNAGSVKDLFTRAVSTTTKDGVTTTTDKGGVITQLESIFKSEFKSSSSILAGKVGLDGTSTQYNNTTTLAIATKKQLLIDLNKSFTDKENALYKKYSDLETAMQKLNSQQSSLASMLGTK